MGRSVSYATGSVHVAFSRFEQDWEDEDSARWQWQDARDDFVADMQRAFPSLAPCNRWLDLEDHALLENAYAYIGVSEYCGLVSMWVTPKKPTTRAVAKYVALRDRWIERIGPRFMRTAANHFGEALHSEGFMSNGVQVFRKAA